MSFASITSTVESAVKSRFSGAEEYARKSWSEAQNYLGDLGGLITTFSPDFVDLDYPIRQINLDAGQAQRPEEPEISLALPAPTFGEPALSAFTIAPITISGLGVASPSIALPAAPAIVFPEDPGQAPAVIEPVLPSRPTESIPAAPTLSEIALPDAPVFQTPQFNGVMPIDTVTDPVSSFVYAEPVYSSAMLDEIKATLLDLLQNGGTGLNADVEEAIWDRARDRKALINERSYSEAEEYFASRGWVLPPGALAGRLQEALAEQTRADEALNQEIAIKQAELAYQATQAAITAGIQLEGALLSHADQVAARALEAAKYVQEAAIALFNAAVARYNARLEAYKVEAAVYETMIRAALLDLERYKTLLEGVKTQKEIQALQIQIYAARVDAVKTVYDLYRTEMETAKVVSDVQRLKLEGYREKVTAYRARLDAITSRYNVYQAQIAGESEKVKLYSEQVRAYGAEIEGKKVESSIRIAEANAKIEGNKLQIDAMRANIDLYKARIGALSEELSNRAKIYGYRVDAFKGDISLVEAKLRADIESAHATLEHEKNQTTLALKQAEVNLEGAIRAHATQVEAMKAGSQITAQLAASAWSSLSAGVSMSADVNQNANYSY